MSRQTAGGDGSSADVANSTASHPTQYPLLHELAHALVRLDHHDDDPELDYATEELLAESVALCVCGFLGLNTAGNSIPYLAFWSEHTDTDAFERIAALVDRLARRLENSIDTTPATGEREAAVTASTG